MNMMQEARALTETIREDRRQLHRRAETGFDLQDTFDYVWKTLEDLGIRPEKIGRCGIRAFLGQGDRMILLRADMDALPIREDSGEPFACTEGRMHACGHDMHTAMLLGAARLLKAHEGELQGRVMLMFQPAEEVLMGASDMLANGLFEGGKPDGAIMIHVLTNMPLPVGTVLVSSPGISAPAANTFEVRIQGKGCHGAMPHTGIDPLNAAAHLVLNLQSLIAREVSVRDDAMLTIGMLQAGDTANVIPDHAVLRGSLRALDDEAYEHLKARLKEVSELTARTFRCTAEVELLSGCPTLRNDKGMSDTAIRSVRGLLGEKGAMLTGEMSGGAARSAGSEDFANLTHEVPAVMLAMAAGQPAEGYSYPAHHPMTRFDEGALPVGAAVYARVAVDFLSGK